MRNFIYANVTGNDYMPKDGKTLTVSKLYKKNTSIIDREQEYSYKLQVAGYKALAPL